MKETRQFNSTIMSTNRSVEGYALVFNSDSRDLGGFVENIDPQSLTGVLEKSDVLCLLNHNEDRGILARCKYGVGSLELEVDDIGLRYKFEAPQTALGDELLEGLKRGDISTSSFAFTVESDTWENRGGIMYRTITKFKEIFDVSPVYQEAYPDTTVALRKMSNFLKHNNIDKEYYNNLRNSINNL